jgi:DNA modification methylase
VVSVRILIGDCRERLKDLPDNSVDSVVCDPPYHLTALPTGTLGYKSSSPSGKAYDRAKMKHASRGFMGQTWDGGDVAFQPETWVEVMRVLKPGGHLIAFSGTRTYHRMAVAIEDAGFEVRDMIAWHYGSGFPKSLDVSKAIDKAAGAEREVVGPGRWNSAKRFKRQAGRLPRSGRAVNTMKPRPPPKPQSNGKATAPL